MENVNSKASKILVSQNIRKSFGGLAAVDDVSIEIERGEISSIIGPNGAGKTTLFNLLTGHLIPDQGEIFFKNDKITGLKPYEICRKGIGRSFQRTNVFPRLSVFDNVHIAVMAWKKRCSNIFIRSERILSREVHEILESIGLNDKGDREAGLLAHGDRRLLEIGIALGSYSELLLLDEPTAGMSPEESISTIKLIRDLARAEGITLLFIEHDMNVVFEFSEKIRVMNLGKVIAEGDPNEIRTNDEVQRIYLAEEI